MAQVQKRAMLTICGFHIHKFTYSLNFICNPQINSCRTSVVTRGQVTVAKNSGCLTCMFPAEAEQGNALPSCFSSRTVKCSLCDYIVSQFLHFVLFLDDFTGNMALKQSAKVLSRVCKSKKAAKCLTKRTGVLGKPIQAGVIVLLV